VILCLVFLQFKAAESILRHRLDVGGLETINEIALESSGRPIRRALEIVADPARHPVAIFCTAGKDRTVRHDAWT